MSFRSLSSPVLHIYIWRKKPLLKNQNLAQQINTKYKEKKLNSKQREYRKQVCYKQIGYVWGFSYINAAQASPVYSQGNDFVISVKYIENEISGSTKCAQT